jgi:hypothetical protein
MIVLCVGMPRAGSGWHYNLVHDLLRTTGCADARDIRRRFHLEGILTEVNCNIGVLSARRLARVSLPAILGHTFVIKAHAGPTAASRLLSALGVLRVTYIYRDPRDAMLSAYEYGQRALQKGQTNAFSDLVDFDRALAFITDYVKIWDKWMRTPNVCVTRYEDLLLNYGPEAARLAVFLGLQADGPQVQKVIADYRPGNAEGQPGTHFVKGRIGRFQQAYTTQQQAILAERFAAALPRMGYSA